MDNENNKILIEEIRKSIPDNYTITDFLNKGGQGSVFIGTFSDRKVAIKIFWPQTDYERVQREIDFLISKPHAFLVRIISTAEILVKGEECILIAYEFYPEGDLTQIIQADDRQLNQREIAKLGFQIGSAVDHLWSNRIVHRDIKPSNILLTDDCDFILGDIGFAQHLDKSALTLPGENPGTPGYMSPEQKGGRKVLTVHSDIFSFGVTMFEAMTKHHPYNRKQPSFSVRLNNKSLNEYRLDLPDKLVNLIHKMLNLAPGSRPVSVTDTFESYLEVE